MAKKIVALKDMANLGAIKRRVANAFSEKGQEAADAIRALIDELEAAEVEVDEEMLAEKIREVLEGEKPDEKIEKAVAEAVAKRVAAINNSVKKELPAKVKNQICSAILKAGNRDAVKNAVSEVLVKNDITGLTFEEVVDYTIVEAWGNYNPLFAQFRKTYYTKFFYNSDTLANAAILAKQWDKTGASEKVIQQLEVTGKTIATQYVYKRQQVAQEDLDEIEKAGETSNFLRFINEELDRQIVNTIMLAILKGDTTNAAGQRLTTFESIGAKTANDVFTTVYPLTSANYNAAPLAALRQLSDTVKNPDGKKKVLVITTQALTAASQFVYAAGGSTDFISRDELAAKIGVDEIITSDLLSDADGNPCAIIMLPDGYWYNEKNAISVSYPQYEKNVLNYQKERNIGGAIHDLYSTAVLRIVSE